MSTDCLSEGPASRLKMVRTAPPERQNTSTMEDHLLHPQNYTEA